ncbi:hypothetical protein [Pseudomonas sp. S1(2024)]|uniref:hypothetical protein n=1 Tax=Pseudomonas sp. S1(2024) TaxID=3390191 RepID=UPI00397E069B
MIDHSVFESANIQRLVETFKPLPEEVLCDEVGTLGADSRRRIITMAGYSAQLTDEDFKLYVSLVAHSAAVMKEHVCSSNSNHSEQLDAVGGFHWLDTLLEESARRSDVGSTQRIYDSSVAILECLHRSVLRNDLSVVTAQRPITSWVQGLMYVGDGSLKIDLDPELVKFMNRVIINRDENLFNAMIYALKKRATLETLGQGMTVATERFASYLETFIPSLSGCATNGSLKIFPASCTQILANLVHLHTHANPENQHLLLPVRDALMALVTDPKGLGRALMQRHMLNSGAAHNWSHIDSVSGYLSSDYISSDDFPGHLRTKTQFAVALSTLNACGKLISSKGQPGVIKRRVKALLEGKGDGHVRDLMAHANRPAQALLGKVIHELAPEFRHCIGERAIAGLLEDDLSL